MRTGLEDRAGEDRAAEGRMPVMLLEGRGEVRLAFSKAPSVGRGQEAGTEARELGSGWASWGAEEAGLGPGSQGAAEGASLEESRWVHFVPGVGMLGPLEAALLHRLPRSWPSTFPSRCEFQMNTPIRVAVGSSGNL